MKRVLQINIVVGLGSTGNIAEQIGQLAMEQGWDSWVAYSARFGDLPSKSHTIKIGTKLNSYLHLLESRLFDNHGLSSRFATRKLIKQIEKIHPDIIHLQNIHGYFVNYEMLFKYIISRDIPVVWTLHDCWAFTGHCAHFIAKNCTKWQTQCDHCPLVKAYPKSLFLDGSKRNFLKKRNLFESVKNMTITTVSKWLGDAARQSFLANKDIRTIYNGIDFSIFEEYQGELRRNNRWEHDFLILGVAKKWHPHKGLNDFLELSKRIDANTKIILIGVDDNLKKKLPSNIIPVKRTRTQRELIEYYSNADVLLNISYAETFGLPTVEAMACGTPAIVYDNTAIPETVDENTGIVVKTGNIDELKNAIDIVRKNGRSHYSTACKERAKKLYDKNERFQEYIDLYNEILIK